MSCNYCWPGNCCGGPNCEYADMIHIRIHAGTDREIGVAHATIEIDITDTLNTNPRWLAAWNELRENVALELIKHASAGNRS